ncbi:MAG TPA: ABC transporter substrate-binding protein [Gemmatimonadales bacterium]|nr:ABC transporter substrate-binding protein [Gemmatimonadales bacterium]
MQSNSRDLHDDMPPALSNRPSDDARPLGALHALRHPGQLLPAAVALLLVMACGGEEHEHAANQGPASDGAPVVMVADSPAETAGVALLPHTPVADGAVGIGVAHDPSKMGMKFVSQGVSLAIEHLNSRGSAYRFAARTSSPGVTSAVQSATELRNDNGVLGVVGHSESGSSLNAIPVYEDVEHDGEHAVVAVSPTATSPRLSGHSRWFFRVCPNDLAASAAVARFALDSLEARRAAVIYRNDSYGRDWTAAFAETFTQGGGEVVQRDPYLAGMTEWDAYAGYMNLREADVFLFPGSVEDAEQAIHAMRRTGREIPFIGGDAASALAASPDEYAGARYTAFFDASVASSPAAIEFIQAFRQAYGEDPDQRAALAYDATILIGEAVIAVGTNRQRIRDWIEKVGTDIPALDGVAGPLAFDRQHDPLERSVLVTRVGAS